MMKAIQLEKWHTFAMEDATDQGTEERTRCEAQMQKIGKLLTLNERAQIRSLQLRSQIRRISRQDLYATTARCGYLSEYSNFRKEVEANPEIDAEQLVNFGIMVEPDTFALWDDDERYEIDLPSEAFPPRQSVVVELHPVEPLVVETETFITLAEAS
jgi:hypothetical protein